MASELVIGGDHPFEQRLKGASISPMVGSIYNMGVWDKGAAAWEHTATRRTLQEEAAARVRYKDAGRGLDNGGCIGDPHIAAHQCLVFLICILHCCMAMNRLQVAFVEARLEALPNVTTEAVQRIHYCARTSAKLGSAAAPDGEESRAFVPSAGGAWAPVGLRPGGW